jgi:glycosyltransferase involved in cell wall biosynthesis
MSPPETRVPLVVVVLTFNSAAVIARTLAAVRPLGAPVQVVDSGSTDGTPELCTRLGAQVVQRPFLHYADQRNWAIARFANQAAWQLHLDADEVASPEAVAAIAAVLRDPQAADAYLLQRRTCFLGRELRFGGTVSHHLRLFRSGRARCERRLYDQHFVCDRPARRLPGHLLDLNVGHLGEWTARHNRWSELEARELLQSGAGGGELAARLSTDPRERRRLFKRGYYLAPPLWRALALFVWRYGVQGGFLDGRAGFLYAFLQTLWFRMLVDAKLHEATLAQAPIPAAQERLP